MTVMERKINAIARSLLANDTAGRNRALAELRGLMVESTKEDRVKNIAEQIDLILLDLGVPDHVLGFHYLQVAIRAAVDNHAIVNEITKALYPMVAETCGTTPGRAERAIRHAIECGWDRGDLDAQNKYFGNKVDPCKGKPTNSEFIARVANIVRSQI